jgi:hypothetical protein
MAWVFFFVKYGSFFLGFTHLIDYVIEINVIFLF